MIIVILIDYINIIHFGFVDFFYSLDKKIVHLINYINIEK